MKKALVTGDSITSDYLDRLREQGFEGVVAKRRDSAYKPVPAVGGVAKNARSPNARFHDRWIHSARSNLRCDPDWRLPGARAPLCRQGSRRLHANAGGGYVQAIPAGSKRKPARSRTCPRHVAASGAKD